MKHKKSVKSTAPAAVVSNNPPSVTVEKAGNGFILSSYTDKGRKTAIAADHTQMMKCMKQMMKK